MTFTQWCHAEIYVHSRCVHTFACLLIQNSPIKAVLCRIQMLAREDPVLGHVKALSAFCACTWSSLLIEKHGTYNSAPKPRPALIEPEQCVTSLPLPGKACVSEVALNHGLNHTCVLTFSDFGERTVLSKFWVWGCQNWCYYSPGRHSQLRGIHHVISVGTPIRAVRPDPCRVTNPSEVHTWVCESESGAPPPRCCTLTDGFSSLTEYFLFSI